MSRKSLQTVKKRAEKIGVGAIKFYLLRVRPTQSINFDPAESISFDGFTGPYCQYAYARISGIQDKITGFEDQYGKLDREAMYGQVDDMELIEWEGELETLERL